MCARTRLCGERSTGLQAALCSNLGQCPLSVGISALLAWSLWWRAGATVAGICGCMRPSGERLISDSSGCRTKPRAFKDADEGRITGVSGKSDIIERHDLLDCLRASAAGCRVFSVTTITKLLLLNLCHQADSRLKLMSPSDASDITDPR